jgi:hypothetical protein
MKESAVTKFILILAFLSFSFAGSRALGQFSSDSPVGVSAGLTKLFGNVNGCVARAEVQVMDASNRESLRAPFGFALLDGNMRMDIDMGQMKGGVPVGLIPGLKKAGLDRVASIVRQDRQLIHLVFSGAHSYVNLEFTPADVASTGKDLQVQKTELGNETVDGRSRAKRKVLVKNPKGATVLEATTWNAAELKDFPVQIALQDKGQTTFLRFRDVRLTKPAASQFDPPKGFKKYSSPEALFFGASIVASGSTNVVAPNSASAAATPKKATTTKPPVAKSNTTKK